jgi:uncharacterized peroxidase-related enzyme
LTRDPVFVQGLIDDAENAPMPARSRALVDYALKLTDAPATVQREDVDRLRQAGLDDRAILDLNMIASYFAFVNRIADGLGVPLEGYWSSEPEP